MHDHLTGGQFSIRGQHLQPCLPLRNHRLFGLSWCFFRVSIAVGRADYHHCDGHLLLDLQVFLTQFHCQAATVQSIKLASIKCFLCP